MLTDFKRIQKKKIIDLLRNDSASMQQMNDTMQINNHLFKVKDP